MDPISITMILLLAGCGATWLDNRWDAAMERVRGGQPTNPWARPIPTPVRAAAQHAVRAGRAAAVEHRGSGNGTWRPAPEAAHSSVPHSTDDPAPVPVAKPHSGPVAQPGPRAARAGVRVWFGAGVEAVREGTRAAPEGWRAGAQPVPSPRTPDPAPDPAPAQPPAQPVPVQPAAPAQPDAQPPAQPTGDQPAATAPTAGDPMGELGPIPTEIADHATLIQVLRRVGAAIEDDMGAAGGGIRSLIAKLAELATKAQAVRTLPERCTPDIGGPTQGRLDEQAAQAALLHRRVTEAMDQLGALQADLQHLAEATTGAQQTATAARG
jgi:hypothetical protein